MLRNLFCVVVMGCWMISGLAASETPTLQVVTENWRPYNYLENGEVKGVSTKIVKEILDKAGFNYDIHVLPWARAYKIAQTKENTLIYTIIRIDPREELFQWIGRLGKGGTTSLYRLKSRKDINPSTIMEAKKHLITTNAKSMDHVWLEHHEFYHLHITPKVENAIKVFFLGRADMIALNDAILEQELANLDYSPDQLQKVMPLFSTPPYLAASLQTSKEVVERLRRAYDEVMAEKKIEW